MDQITSLFSSSSSKPSHHSEGEKGHGESASPGDVMASAQLLFGAAKSKLQHGKDSESQGEDLDVARLAGAASDVLDAAQRYGKLEGTKYGDYVQKAEDYLQSYEQKHKAGAAPAHGRPPSSSEETEYEEHSEHRRQEVQHGKHSSEETDYEGHNERRKQEVQYGKHSSEETDYEGHNEHRRQEVQYGKHPSEESDDRYEKEEDSAEESDNKYAKYFQKAQEYFNK